MSPGSTAHRTAGRSALQASDLTVRYHDFTAVDAISMDIFAGEIYGLLGPNGAGKTSVIRALTTIVPIASGTASVAGHSLSQPVHVRSAIGVLPESNGYPGSQTARAYLRFYGQLFGLDVSEADRRADRLLTQLGLGTAHRRIATFSRGMRQRLGLARALVNDPAVLFLDEPTLGLDPAGQEEIMAHLTRVAVEEGTCVILCSHLLDEVERVCDRVGIMNDGRIVTEGNVEEVVAASGAVSYGKVRVSPTATGHAHSVLLASPAVETLRLDNTRPGDIDLRLQPVDGARRQVLRALLDADIEPRSFDLHGARLSDAFLAVTGSTNADDRSTVSTGADR